MDARVVDDKACSCRVYERLQMKESETGSRNKWMYDAQGSFSASTIQLGQFAGPNQGTLLAATPEDYEPKITTVAEKNSGIRRQMMARWSHSRIKKVRTNTETGSRR